ncbi:hypothetical protein NWT09_22170 [Mycolicibacterium sp. jd]|uniref:hypothetical protein n=1 Tax=unclassified Mycolicibacterium TaxID=2636767 RepID=UPI00351AB23B
MNREDSWQEAVAHYRAGVKDSMLAEYRCRVKGCLLLRVWNSPNGPEFFAPAARVSDQYTSAGQWHWLGFNRADTNKTGDRAGRVAELASLQLGGWLWLLCEHVKESVRTREILHDFAGVEPGNPARVFIPR